MVRQALAEDRPQPKPWQQCTKCGHRNHGDNLHCAGCGAAKSPQWVVLPPRNQSKGKGKGGKGRSESENNGKGKGKGKDPSYHRKPQLEGWVQVVRRGAATGQPAGQGPASAGAALNNNEKRQAAQIAALQRQLAAKTLDATVPADVPVESEDAAGRTCPNCTASHKNAKKATCRLCDHSLTAACAPVAAPAALSAEGIAARRANLLAGKDAMVNGGFLQPAPLAAALKDIEAQLLSLDKSPAEPEAKNQFDQLNDARVAADKAQEYCNSLTP